VHFRSSVVLVSSWFWFAIALPAQQPTPVGLIRGQLLECDPAGSEGELSIRASTNQVYRFRYDSKTYFEIENRRTTADGLRKGDPIEVLADRVAGLNLSYARTVHVLEPVRKQRPTFSLGRYRAYRSALEPLLPSGDLTFSGVVQRLNGDWLLLRTRLDGEKRILLREDTHYLAEGAPVNASALKPNMRVFIRAGRNLDNDLEAYQVIWGAILDPGSAR